MSRGIIWLDTGTVDNLYLASQFVNTLQKQQGQYIACLEEIAYNMGYINLKKLEEVGNRMKTTDYGKYILDICDRERKEGKH